MKTKQNNSTNSFFKVAIFIAAFTSFSKPIFGQEYYYSNDQPVELTSDYRELIVFFNSDIDLDAVNANHAFLLSTERHCSGRVILDSMDSTIWRLLRQP